MTIFPAPSIRSCALALALGAACAGPALAEGSAPAGAASAPQRHHATHHAAGAALDDRIRTLTRALGLDAAQQAALRQVLEGGRVEALRILSDPSVPAAERVLEFQMLSDRTSDRIRSLLSDDQKKLYNPPRIQHDPASGRPKPNVADWIGGNGQN